MTSETEPPAPTTPVLRPDLPTEPPAGWADDPVDVALNSLSGTPVLTPLIIALNVAIFGAMLATGVSVMSPDIHELVRWGANTGPRTLAGEWWRLGSSMFIHIGVLHILMNMAVLWEVGRLLERLVGRAGFVAAYAVTGLAGSMASVWWNPNAISAGASGAVFGVLGCIVGLLIRDRRSIPVAARGRVAKMAAVFIGYNLLFGASIDGIDMAAHLGGLGAGILCGVALALPLEPASLAKRPVRAGLVVVLGALGLAAGTQLAGDAPMELYADQRVPFGDSSVFYAGEATKADARALGAFLESINYIDKGRETASVVVRNGSGYVVGLVVKAGAHNNEQAAAAFDELAHMMSAQAFDGAPVEVRMLDEHVRVLRRFGPHATPTDAAPGPQQLFVVGIELARLRTSPLWTRYSKAFARWLGTDDLAPCEQTLVDSLERVLIELSQDANGQWFAVVVDGVTRDATEACLREGEPEVSATRDGAHTLLGDGDSAIALRWTGQTQVMFAARQSADTDGPTPVSDWALVDGVDPDNPFGLTGTGPLGVSFGRIHPDAVAWLAAGSPAAYASVRMTDTVQLEARFYAESPEIAQAFLTRIAAMAGPVAELPSARAFLDSVEIATDGGIITVTGAWNEAQLVQLSTTIAGDEQLRALFE